jgi:DNA repair exonuclease SbcCD ATPase subunit
MSDRRVRLEYRIGDPSLKARLLQYAASQGVAVSDVLNELVLKELPNPALASSNPDALTPTERLQQNLKNLENEMSELDAALEDIRKNEKHQHACEVGILLQAAYPQFLYKALNIFGERVDFGHWDQIKYAAIEALKQKEPPWLKVDRLRRIHINSIQDIFKACRFMSQAQELTERYWEKRKQYDKLSAELETMRVEAVMGSGQPFNWLFGGSRE